MSPFSQSYWKGVQVDGVTGKPVPGSKSAFGSQSDRSYSQGGTGSERALARSKAANDHALVLARARGRSPTRWGPAGERRLSVAHRPHWRNNVGFPDLTIQSEHRRMDPFSDINSYASRTGYLGARPLDCKGMNGARPVQQWKEMLRGGSR